MFRRPTSTTKLLGIGILFTANVMQSCVVFNYNRPPEYAIDIVCGMKADKSEAYDFTYKGDKYYFDTYDCKEIFKHNPQKFIDNKCTEVK